MILTLHLKPRIPGHPHEVHRPFAELGIPVRPRSDKKADVGKWLAMIRDAARRWAADIVDDDFQVMDWSMSETKERYE